MTWRGPLGELSDDLSQKESTISSQAIKQVVDFPTRDGNTLDLLITSHPSLVDECKPLPSLDKSDHDTILVDLSNSSNYKTKQEEDIPVEQSKAVIEEEIK